jgi:hypothetical protein
MIGWISRFFARLEQNNRGKPVRTPPSAVRTWDAFLEADLETIAKASASNGAGRLLLQRRLASASDVIDRAKGEREALAVEILTEACDAAGDDRREAMQRGAVSFDDPDMAAASAAEAWLLATIQHRQGRIDDDVLGRIEKLIGRLRAPVPA